MCFHWMTKNDEVQYLIATDITHVLNELFFHDGTTEQRREEAAYTNEWSQEEEKWE